MSIVAGRCCIIGCEERGTWYWATPGYAREHHYRCDRHMAITGSRGLGRNFMRIPMVTPDRMPDVLRRARRHL